MNTAETKQTGSQTNQPAIDTKQPGVGVSLRGVTKSFGGTNAVDEVSFSVLPGEFMTLLGPSGSGKTTTLNIIAGFLTLDSGDLLLGDESVAALPPRKRGIGMVFQNYALFPNMNVAENVEFPLRQRKIPKPQRRELVARAIRTVRLEGYEKRSPNQLSGGQQQRVALARAIVFQPRLLLMDEPLGALDRTLRDTMQLELRRIHREVGCTVVMVTHDQEEALALSDRIAVFDSGQVRQIGTARELYEQPADVTVAKFLGESSRITGTVVPSGTGTMLDFQGIPIRTPSTTLAANTRATLVIRPERAGLSPMESSPEPNHAQVMAEVLEEIYLGSGRKVSVRLPDGSAGIVRESAGQITAFRPGDICALTWSIRDSVLLPAD